MRLQEWGIIIAIAGLTLAHVELARKRLLVQLKVDELVELSLEKTRDAEESNRQVSDREQLSAFVLMVGNVTQAPENMGSFRNSLVASEKGLEIRRLSMDFRPEQHLSTGLGGSYITASLRGSFDAVFKYLTRVEALRLPLSPENLVLRTDNSYVTLTISWSARWPKHDVVTQLQDRDIEMLGQWFSREPNVSSGRDLFAVGTTRIAKAVPPLVKRQAAGAFGKQAEKKFDFEAQKIPVLTGFVTSPSESSVTDTGQKVFAALQYDGETRFVVVGDVFGNYVVEKIQERESVTLLNSFDGKRFVLTLE